MNILGLPEATRALLALALTDPAAAAARMREMARRLLDAAEDLERQAGSGPPRDPGALVDRVQMRVVGPNGEIKQRVDTANGGPGHG